MTHAEANPSQHPGSDSGRAADPPVLRRPEMQVVLLAIVLELAAVVWIIATPDRGDSVRDGGLWAFVVVAVLFGLFEYMVFNVQFRREGISFSLSEVPVAFGLVFDPRYKDFPFAPLTAAIVPIVLVAAASRSDRRQGLADRIAAATLALSAVYIFFNESIANWQSVWLCVLLLALSLSLVRFRWPRAAQS